MDFRQSNPAPARVEPNINTQQPPQKPNVNHHPVNAPDGGKSLGSRMPKWINALTLLALFGVTTLLLLTSVVAARGNGDSGEKKLVDSGKYQAVFLNNGQVYFGNVSDLNNKFINLRNIYYLTQSTTAGANGQAQTTGDYTLVKLGCQQIHYPTDQMVINRDQVTFWENLSADGKVAKSIEEFKKQNPNGPDCSEVSSQTQATSNQATQGSATPSNTTTQKPAN